MNKLLVVFPHPDDEVLTVGGTIANYDTTLYVATKGERGTPDASLYSKLKEIRTKELNRSVQILGFNKLILDDLGDGQLDKKIKQLTTRFIEILEQEKPNLVITYDLSGFYGHPDHMALSEVVTQVLNKPKYKHIHLWYVSGNPIVAKFIKLPTHMAKDKNFTLKKTTPNHNVFIGLRIFNNLRALYAHESQFQSFTSATPLGLPIWLFAPIFMWEYFYKVK